MMVPDADDHWRLANEIGARIVVPLLIGITVCAIS